MISRILKWFMPAGDQDDVDIPRYDPEDPGYWVQRIPNCCPPPQIVPKNLDARVPLMIHVCPKCKSKWETLRNGLWYCTDRKGIAWERTNPPETGWKD